MAKIENGWLLEDDQSLIRRKNVNNKLRKLGYSNTFRRGVYNRMIVHDARRAMNAVLNIMMKGG